MTKCTKILMSAVMGISLTSAAWAQSSSGSGSTGGSTGTGSVGGSSGAGSTGAGSTGAGSSAGSSSTGGATGASGSSSSTGGASGADTSTSTGSSSTDAMGSQSSSQSRDMQRGAMGSDADQKMSAQLDKIASMPDKAADALFVLDAAKGNLFEVEFARLAGQKAQDPQVKELAQMIQKDHQQANEQLKPIAQKMQLELPTSLPSDKQKMLSVYQAMSVQDFETCFILENKAAHAKQITSFADHQKSVKDEGLRGYVSATLPKLQQHGQHVQQVAASKGFTGEMALNGTSGGAASGSMQSGTSRTLTPGSTPGAGGTGDVKPGGSGAPSDPTDPANNQNPSNR